MGRLLFPDMGSYGRFEVNLTPVDKINLARLALVQEVIDALGLRGPYDVETEIPDFGAGPVRDALLATRCFAKWKETKRLMGSKMSPTEWTPDKIGKALQAVFGVVGLRLVCTRTQKRVNSKRMSENVRRIDDKAVSKMKELLALRAGDVDGSGRWKHLVEPAFEAPEDVSTPMPV